MNRTTGIFLTSIITAAVIAVPVLGKEDVKKMIFSDQRIEGKIRRPQLVLITADQRPEFQPMVMQSLGKSGNITGSVNEEIINNSPYKKAFQFDGTKITNYAH